MERGSGFLRSQDGSLNLSSLSTIRLSKLKRSALSAPVSGSISGPAVVISRRRSQPNICDETCHRATSIVPKKITFQPISPYFSSHSGRFTISGYVPSVSGDGPVAARDIPSNHSSDTGKNLDRRCAISKAMLFTPLHTHFKANRNNCIKSAVTTELMSKPTTRIRPILASKSQVQRPRWDIIDQPALA